MASTAARRTPPPAATCPSDSLGWPDGPRGTLVAPGFPFCFSRENLACPTDHQSDVHVDRMSRNCRQQLSASTATAARRDTVFGGASPGRDTFATAVIAEATYRRRLLTVYSEPVREESSVPLDALMICYFKGERIIQFNAFAFAM